MMLHFNDSILDRYLQQADVIVFDLNGLMIDDEPVQLAATNAALEPFGKYLSEQDWITLCVGHKPAEYLPLVLGEEIAADALSSLVHTKDQLYATLIAQQVHALVPQGLDALMQAAARAGKALALATATTRAGVAIILGSTGLNWLDRFAFTLCGDQVKKAKPDPETYLCIKDKLGGAKKYLVFEDSRPGVLAAKGAGMTCLAVPNRFTLQQDLTPADCVITGFTPDACFHPNFPKAP